MSLQWTVTVFWWKIENLLKNDHMKAPPPKGWKNNIKMDLTLLGCDDGRWMELTQDRLQCRGLVLAELTSGLYYLYLFTNENGPFEFNRNDFFCILINCPPAFFHLSLSCICILPPVFLSYNFQLRCKFGRPRSFLWKCGVSRIVGRWVQRW